MKETRKQLAYAKSGVSAQFREQYRFVFSVAVIATVFVVPFDSIFEILLKSALAFSALFSALFLVTTAANLKYSDPGIMYQMLYVGERFRMRMYDFSVDTFAAAMLYVFGLTTIAVVQLLIGVELQGFWQWFVLISSMILYGIVILLVSRRLKVKERKRVKKLPKI